MTTPATAIDPRDAAAVITSEDGASDVMQCMEVWGGNDAVDANVSISGLDLWVYSKPYEQADAGGDVYYLSSCATGRITRLLIADVSGHGQRVRETAITLRDLMRRYVNRLDQTQFVRSLNREFLELNKAGTFATAIAMTFFGPTNFLTLCNAGHPAPLLYTSATRTWSIVENRLAEETVSADEQHIVNIPLGIDDVVDYEQFGIELAAGDLVLCYSDSLIESYDSTGEMLGERGLLSMVEQLDVREPATLVARLRASLEQLNPQNLITDDVTTLLFRANGAGATGVPLRRKLQAAWKVPVNVLRGLLPGGGPIALPDFSVPNLLGLISARFNRSWNASRFARHTER